MSLLVEEYGRNLRQMETEAFAMLVSVLRAQGPLTNEKKRLLKEACKVLYISPERHKTEIRRASNDDRLHKIAVQMNGASMSAEEWYHEGRRALPMLQRISPQTLRPIITSNLPRTPTENELKETVMEEDENDQEFTEKDSSEQLPQINSTYEPVRPKKILGKGQKLMLVPNNHIASAAGSNGTLHKTLSVPIAKVTKLNLDKFKIIPSKTLSSSSIHVTGKKIIPVSQFQILNHRFSSKSGGIKVLPFKGKFLGKNITMARITPIQEIKNIPPLAVTSKTEDPEVKSDKVEEQNNTEPKKEEEIKEETVKKEEVNNETSDDLAALMEIDSSEFIEPDLKETSTQSKQDLEDIK